MSLVLDAVSNYALEHAESIAIQGNKTHITYSQLQDSLNQTSVFLSAQHAHTIALLMDNTPATLIVDLACMQKALTLIPIPLFFSAKQVSHSLQSSGCDLLISNLAEKAEFLLQVAEIKYDKIIALSVADESLQVYRLYMDTVDHIPKHTCKITYTSGSTGDAKGVCLNQQAIDTVVSSLMQATYANSQDKHLCLLPYATLLENIAGMYVPLLAGATVCLPGLAQVGMQGSSNLDVKQFMLSLHQSAATTCVMIPQMLQALVAALQAGLTRPPALRFIAVGGAPVSHILLEQAQALGLPVYEGYGLSEAASVVSLNTLEAQKQGSVGRPLPHVQLSIAADGEIILHQHMFSAYLGENSSAGEVWSTGDIGYVDDDGFLYIKGRKKHIFITSFGRNVSPEWVESELNIEPAIAQSCVFGEAKAFNVAIVYLRQGFDRKALDAALISVNARLPDYAQVRRYILADVPFCIENEQWTGTGRPRRRVIEQCYKQALIDIYGKEKV